MTQGEALALLKTGASIFLTGQPGSGKTHTVNRYLHWLRQQGVDYAYTASTGIAATHGHGVTIHAWSGIGVRDALHRRDLDTLAANRRLATRIERAKVLVIDEISMLPARSLTLVDTVCRHIRGVPSPFGGLQVVLVGDFFQLPPVVRRGAESGMLPLGPGEDSFGAEFAHLDRLWDPEISQHGNDRIDWSEESRHRALDLKAKGQPALLFAAHLANWELAAVGAHQLGFKTAVLYRPPNVSAVAEAAVEMRARLMGTLIPTDFTAPIRIAEEIGRGSLVGMLVDQYHTKGVDVTFFGRPARTNPLIARLARQFECPIYGVRSVRLPEGRIRLELTRPIDTPRDADGRIDIAGTMQRINDVVEGWVREHPEQWLWVHRRWR